MFLNIPLGTCNGDYAVVLEVPQVMLEERLDNNFTWFPVTLTQQTGVPNVPEITSSATNLVCEGDNISLSIDAPDNTTLLWSDGSTSESIEINQAGTYSVTVTSEEFSCPTTKNIVVSTIDGTILELPLEAGSSVTQRNDYSEGSSIATVSDLTQLVFQGEINEQDLGNLQPGMEFDVTLTAHKDKKFKTTLDFISPKGEIKNGIVSFDFRGKLLSNLSDSILDRSGYSGFAGISI